MTPIDQQALIEAENFFHERIPLTLAMGLRVVADPVHDFAIEASVALNYNHLHTAFGGSINAIATLAGYGFLWLNLRDLGVHVVVGSSSIRFVQPVHEQIRAVCLAPTSAHYDTFRERLRMKGKSRITLQIRVEDGGDLKAEFEGVFVVFKDLQTGAVTDV